MGNIDDNIVGRTCHSPPYLNSLINKKDIWNRGSQIYPEMRKNIFLKKSFCLIYRCIAYISHLNLRYPSSGSRSKQGKCIPRKIDDVWISITIRTIICFYHDSYSASRNIQKPTEWSTTDGCRIIGLRKHLTIRSRTAFERVRIIGSFFRYRICVCKMDEKNKRKNKRESDSHRKRKKHTRRICFFSDFAIITG